MPLLSVPVTTFCFLDVETTGTDPAVHQVWEIGMILRDDETGAEREYLWQRRPSLAFADPKALDVGGYYERCVVRDDPEGTVATLAAPDGARITRDTEGLAFDLTTLLHGVVPVGVNVAAFDVAFIKALCRRRAHYPQPSYHAVELSSAAAGYLWAQGADVPVPWKSDTLAAAVGVDPAGYDRHTALGDARFSRAIFDRVRGGRVAQSGVARVEPPSPAPRPVS